MRRPSALFKLALLTALGLLHSLSFGQTQSLGAWQLERLFDPFAQQERCLVAVGGSALGALQVGLYGAGQERAVVATQQGYGGREPLVSAATRLILDGDEAQAVTFDQLGGFVDTVNQLLAAASARVDGMANNAFLALNAVPLDLVNLPQALAAFNACLGVNTIVNCSCLAVTYGELTNAAMPGTFCQSGETTDAALSRLLTVESFRPFAATVARLYFGVLNRDPDAPGLLFWSDRFRALGQGALVELAIAFLASPEAAALFGGELLAAGQEDYIDNDEFVARLYTSILGRQPDPAGLAYWQGELSNNPYFVDRPTVALQRGLFVQAFTEAPEYIAAQAIRLDEQLLAIGQGRYSVACLAAQP